MTSSDKTYSRIKQNIRSKRVADVVKALIGAYLSSSGEVAVLSLMKWLGMDIDFVDAPIQRHFPLNAEKLVNVRYFESLLHYKFHDPSLLVEALTHGSYMLPEIPRCYQVILDYKLSSVSLSLHRTPKVRISRRCAVLDYVVTSHLYFKYPGLSPGLITDLRSASVNNECYAQSAVKASLHKHIRHASPDLQRQICNTIEDFKKLNLVSTFGWSLGDDGLVRLLFCESMVSKSERFAFADRDPSGKGMMPKQIHEIKDFLLTARRKDARSVKIKKNKDMVKFKVRCSKYLYTLCVRL
ncbi:hypothetical protein KY290_007108 [Solanum tuberosum]|uniref:RNase III domain-containing protein n=1 Tax=Solanum tuberosum TaxID=4113 RepID=A0ABQ7W786_SOLTU|nr:hypothetical protein KY290_007108 [Solanum tuberosum]